MAIAFQADRLAGKHLPRMRNALRKVVTGVFLWSSVNPWGPCDSALLAEQLQTSWLAARRLSTVGTPRRTTLARCEGSRPAPGYVSRLLSRTPYRLPWSVPGGLLVQTSPYPAGSAATQFGMSAERSRARPNRSFPEAYVAISAVLILTSCRRGVLNVSSGQARLVTGCCGT